VGVIEFFNIVPIGLYSKDDDAARVVGEGSKFLTPQCI
jgi:hypothetical protein